MKQPAPRKPGSNQPVFRDLSEKPIGYLERKLAKSIEQATARLRPKARLFWEKPKPFLVSDLVIGDLAFSRFKSKLGDSLASSITGYPPMHVSLYIGNGEFFDFSRRAKIVLAETLFEYYPTPFLFRPQRLSEEQKEKIVSLARRMAKNKIERGSHIRLLIGMQRTLGISVKNPKERGYLCSSAIAEFFANAGVTLVPGVHSKRVSPTDLMKSKKLKAINA